DLLVRPLDDLCRRSLGSHDAVPPVEIEVRIALLGHRRHIGKRWVALRCRNGEYDRLAVRNRLLGRANGRRIDVDATTPQVLQRLRCRPVSDHVDLAVEAAEVALERQMAETTGSNIGGL